MFSKLQDHEKEELCEHFVDAMTGDPHGFSAISGRKGVKRFFEDAIQRGVLIPEQDLLLVLDHFLNFNFLNDNVLRQVNIVNDLNSSESAIEAAKVAILSTIARTHEFHEFDPSLTVLDWNDI